MYQNNRNLFPFFAVLMSAGIITGFYGIVFWVAEHIGSQSRLVLNATDQGLEGSFNTAPKTAATASSSRILGTHEATVLSLTAFSGAPDNPFSSLPIASGSYDSKVKLWDASWDASKGLNPGASAEKSAEKSAEVQTLTHHGRVNDLAFIAGESPSQASQSKQTHRERAYQYRLVTGSGAGEIKLWGFPSGNLITTIAEPSGRILSLAVSADNTLIASGSSDGALKLWPVEGISEQKSQTNLRANLLGRAIAQSGPAIRALAFHPTNSNLVVSGNQAGTIQVWDIQQSQPLFTLNNGADRITNLAISPDGRYVASGSYDKLIRIWNLASGELISTLSGHDFVVADVAFSPDGQTLASASYDESIKLWDWASSKERCTLRGHDGFVYSLAFTAGGNALISGGHDGTVRAWNLTAPSKGCLK
ncbi:MAG: WD40 repeat domain-containing protein [Phormidesmis sp.]